MVPGFQQALVAANAHPSIPEADRIFAPFIGSWSLEVTWFAPDGEVERSAKGEWHFSWVLDGRAIQDVWITPSRAEVAEGAAAYEYGTSLRFYDPASGAWRSNWIGPMRDTVLKFEASRIGEEVVLQGIAQERPMRWIFSDIGADHFLWRNEGEQPDGRWLVQQRFSATRIQA